MASKQASVGWWYANIWTPLNVWNEMLQSLEVVLLDWQLPVSCLAMGSFRKYLKRIGKLVVSGNT